MAWMQEGAPRLAEDPDWFDAKVAGWWVWGQCLWIGSGWCIEGGKSEVQPKASPGGMGVSSQTVDRDTMPTVSVGGGKGVSAQARGDILRWFEDLQARLRRVIVLNRDWTSAVTPSVLGDTETAQGRKVNRCIFMDPPYRQHGKNMKLYDGGERDDDVAVAAYEWAVEHGERYRIAYCCQVGDFPLPDGWTQSELQVQRGTGTRQSKHGGQAAGHDHVLAHLQGAWPRIAVLTRGGR